MVRIAPGWKAWWEEARGSPGPYPRGTSPRRGLALWMAMPRVIKPGMVEAQGSPWTARAKLWSSKARGGGGYRKHARQDLGTGPRSPGMGRKLVGQKPMGRSRQRGRQAKGSKSCGQNPKRGQAWRGKGLGGTARWGKPRGWKPVGLGPWEYTSLEQFRPFGKAWGLPNSSEWPRWGTAGRRDRQTEP
jgi:hypothetical protein